MNEPLFYNSFTYSEEMAKEIAFHFLFKTKLMKFFLTVIIIFLPINILLAVWIEQITFYQITTFALTGMTFLLWPIAYFSMVKANTPKGNDDGFSIITADYTMINGKWRNSEISCEIKKISLFFETKNYIVVFPKMTARTGMVLKKDAFSVGNAEDFIKLLKTRCASAGWMM